MGELKNLEKISKGFVPKGKYKKISKLKDKKDKIDLFKHALTSELRIKHLNFEIKLKKLKNKEKKHLINLKSNIIPSKINLLQTNFNERDFNKIIFSLEKLEEDLSNA
ncbi:MAG: hypothetical protein WC915_06720 [archaeon]|jgi:hypothetical protein